MGAKTAIATGLVLGLLFVASRAEASPSARLIYLRGKGTEQCPDESVLHEAVATRLGYDPFSSYALDTMFAEVSAEPGGFVAQLKLVDHESNIRGDRTLHVTGRCEELMGAMALTMSLVIDPMSATRDGPPKDAPPQERQVEIPAVGAAPGGDDAAASPPAPAPPPSPSPSMVFTLGLGPRGTIGSAPGPAFGGALEAQARLGLLVAGLEGRADLPASAGAGTLGRVSSWLLATNLLVGAREGAIFACGELSIGRIAATSSDVAQSKEDTALSVGAGARIGAALGIGDRLEARAFVEALGALVRNTLFISGQEAYRYPVASGGIGATLAVRIP